MDEFQTPGGGMVGLPNLAWLLFQESGEIGMYSLYHDLSLKDEEDEKLR